MWWNSQRERRWNQEEPLNFHFLSLCWQWVNINLKKKLWSSNKHFRWNKLDVLDRLWWRNLKYPQEHAGTERWWIQTQDLLDLRKKRSANNDNNKNINNNYFLPLPLNITVVEALIINSLSSIFYLLIFIYVYILFIHLFIFLHYFLSLFSWLVIFLRIMTYENRDNYFWFEDCNL